MQQSQNSTTDDDLWRRAFEILQKSDHLSSSERRAFVASATDDPAVLGLLDEWLADEDDAENSSTPDEHVSPESRIGHYEILNPLGSGGTGRIFRALDLELGRVVALKFLSDEIATTQSRLNALLREARTASALNHPNIVTVYELVRSGETTAIVMELLSGRSLRELCGTPLPVPKLLAYGCQVASALAAAHRKQIVHRDIKPENVMLAEDEQVKVVDFGMARQLSANASTTFHNVGTIQYFSPEQARGERATPASDVFSLGIVFYELATGHHPFAQETAMGTLYGILNLHPEPPARDLSGVPAKLSRLILEMLSKQADKRPSADEVLARLSQLRTEKTSSAHPWIAAAFALILATVVSVLVFRAYTGAAREITFQEQTSTDTENRVTAVAISPDGAQFAYADITGAIFLQSVEDKRTRLLYKRDSEVVEKISWFPDQSSLLVVARHLSASHSSVRIASVKDAEPKLIQDRIGTAALSPDGLRLAVTSPDSQEIWLQQLKSNPTAKKLITAGKDETFPVIAWSAKGQYLICQRRTQLARVPKEREPARVMSRFRWAYESIDTTTGAVAHHREDTTMRSVAIQPDGRVLFLNTDTDGFSTTLWEMKTDLETGRVEEPPRALNQYDKMALASLSASQDGTRIVAVHYQYQPDVHIADFDAGSKEIIRSRRLTLDRAHDYPHSFSADGQTVFFESTRNGTFDIFRQRITEGHAEFVAGRPGRDEFNPILTPDGKWILFAAQEAGGGKGRTLERIAVEGGEPATVPIGGKLDYFDCALPGGKRCVLRITESQAYVFYELDPILGKGRELARVPWSPGVMGDWSLSADGSEVAIPNHDISERLIRVVPLDSPGQFGYVIRLKGSEEMINSIRYSADGTGWFVVLRQHDDYFRTAPLLKVNLVFVNRQGIITPLREIPITTWAVVAAGGKRITFPDGSVTGNVVLLQR